MVSIGGKWPRSGRGVKKSANVFALSNIHGPSSQDTQGGCPWFDLGLTDSLWPLGEVIPSGIPSPGLSSESPVFGVRGRVSYNALS